MNDFAGVRIFAHLAIEEIVFADDAFFQRRRGENRFESRTGLETVRHRAIASLIGGLFGIVVGSNDG